MPIGLLMLHINIHMRISGVSSIAGYIRGILCQLDSLYPEEDPVTHNRAQIDVEILSFLEKDYFNQKPKWTNKRATTSAMRPRILPAEQTKFRDIRPEWHNWKKPTGKFFIFTMFSRGVRQNKHKIFGVNRFYSLYTRQVSDNCTSREVSLKLQPSVTRRSCLLFSQQVRVPCHRWLALPLQLTSMLSPSAGC